MTKNVVGHPISVSFRSYHVWLVQLQKRGPNMT